MNELTGRGGKSKGKKLQQKVPIDVEAPALEAKPALPGSVTPYEPDVCDDSPSINVPHQSSY